MIGIINYKAGNCKSVLNSCEHLNLEAKLISTKEDFYTVDRIILPGVGSAGETMKSLYELDIIDTLTKRVFEDKVPFLGICVGMQVLFEHSDEDDAKCLGWLKGKVVKFDEQKLRVPQIGWNKIELCKNSRLVPSELDGSYFYFVNSFYVVPVEETDVLAKTAYGDYFTSMVERDNIFASQCHIEKSGNAGLTVLKRFSVV